MACRNAYTTSIIHEFEKASSKISDPIVEERVSKLYFGVDSKIQSDDLLQNNIDMFEWILRNKIHPNFYGRYITGLDALTKEEISFLHSKGCKICPIYSVSCKKEREIEGIKIAEGIEGIVFDLGIPKQTVIFLEIEDGEDITTDFMRGFVTAMIKFGYTPGFKTNTDARYGFDRAFSRGLQTDGDAFSKCLIWAVAPTIKEYDGMTTTHLIHPDEWKPFAPSGVSREQIAIWTYGKNCHPIADDNEKQTTFNLDLVRNKDVIINKMF